MKKYVSIILILIIGFFLVTSSVMLPKLDIAKNINIMSILKVLNLPQRTIIYINSLFSGEKSDMPAVPKKEAGGDHLFRHLIISLMGALVLPVTFRLTEPEELPLYSSDNSGGASGRAPPPDSGQRTGGSPREALKFNSSRERRSTVSINKDSSDDGVSGQSDPDPDNSSHSLTSLKEISQILFDNFCDIIAEYSVRGIPFTYMCKERDILLCRKKGTIWRLDS